MGDIAAADICEKFIAEFGEQLFDRYAIFPHTAPQSVGFDEEFNVRMCLTVQDSLFYGQEIFFHMYLDEEDTLNSLLDRLKVDSDSPEAVVIAEKVKRVFA
jgi:hypothetical protein